MPETKPDGAGGTVVVRKTTTICPECGGICDQEMSYVWKGTKRERLLELGYGASVKHYYTVCRSCGLGTYS